MQLHWRKPAPQELDHELLWLTVSLGTGLALAGWFAAQLPTPRCAFHSLTGLPCVTCGATRAAIQFLHGHFSTSLFYNPLAFLTFSSLVVFDLYALAVVPTGAPRLRVENFSPAEKFAARSIAIALLAANWVYLLTLGRVHKSGEIERAVNSAREAGFESLNLDLMFALPNQSMFGWKSNLRRALALNPEHLSLYCLTIEENTAFYKQNLRGQLQLPDEDAQVEMYDECVRETAAAGFEHYEISNFAKPGHRSQHNLCYWRAEDYAGYGPGAVGCVDGIRYTNSKHPVGYSEKVEQGLALAFESEILTAEHRRLEKIMLGLRLMEGLKIGETEYSSVGFETCQARGWLYRGDGRLFLTEAGEHFCSEVSLELAALNQVSTIHV